MHAERGRVRHARDSEMRFVGKWDGSRGVTVWGTRRRFAEMKSKGFCVARTNEERTLVRSLKAIAVRSQRVVSANHGVEVEATLPIGRDDAERRTSTPARG